MFAMIGGLLSRFGKRSLIGYAVFLVVEGTKQGETLVIYGIVGSEEGQHMTARENVTD